MRGDLVGREVMLFEKIKLLLFRFLQAVDGVVDGPVVGADVERALGQDQADGEVGHDLTSHEGQCLLGRGVLGGLSPPRHAQHT